MSPLPVVLVAVLERYDMVGDEVRIIDKILENRYEYAMAHGIDASRQTAVDNRL